VACNTLCLLARPADDSLFDISSHAVMLQVCNDKCDTVFEKTCTKVPVTTTECAMVKVVNLVKQCNKK
jgi:hypothetical protein